MTTFYRGGVTLQGLKYTTIYLSNHGSKKFHFVIVKEKTETENVSKFTLVHGIRTGTCTRKYIYGPFEKSVEVRNDKNVEEIFFMSC